MAAPLLADFRRLYPRVSVSYEDLGSTELYHRFIAENQLGREAADVLWSSAMDHMVALATAHPAKFPDAIAEATGQDLARHPALDALKSAPTRCEVVENRAEAVKAYLAARAI